MLHRCILFKFERCCFASKSQEGTQHGRMQVLHANSHCWQCICTYLTSQHTKVTLYYPEFPEQQLQQKHHPYCLVTGTQTYGLRESSERKHTWEWDRFKSPSSKLQISQFINTIFEFLNTNSRYLNTNPLFISNNSRFLNANPLFINMNSWFCKHSNWFINKLVYL